MVIKNSPNSKIFLVKIGKIKKSLRSPTNHPNLIHISLGLAKDNSNSSALAGLLFSCDEISLSKRQWLTQCRGNGVTTDPY